MDGRGGPPLPRYVTAGRSIDQLLGSRRRARVEVRILRRNRVGRLSRSAFLADSLDQLSLRPSGRPRVGGTDPGSQLEVQPGRRPGRGQIRLNEPHAGSQSGGRFHVRCSSGHGARGGGLRNGSASGPSSANPPRTNPPHPPITMHIVAGSGPRRSANARSDSRAPLSSAIRP
jgi:hypothetical protein